MPAAGLLVVALFVAVAVGGGLLLYGAVRSEHGRRRVMDRESAERVARRDTDATDDRPSTDRQSTDRDRETSRWE